MSVSRDEVLRIAALARLAVNDARADALAEELSGILEHMEQLQRVDTDGVEPVVGVGAAGLPLRPDEGPPAPLSRDIASFAPRLREGFFLVPRLATHEDPEPAP